MEAKSNNYAPLENQEFFYSPFNEISRKMPMLIRTGQLLMEYGSNTSNIERNLRRIAVYMGISFTQIHFHITYSTIMINITDEDRSYTSFGTVRKHGANMTIISAISKLSWRALEKCYTLDEFEAELDRISNISSHYPLPLLTLMAGIACGCFAILFGGTLFSALITAICAGVGYNVRYYCNKLQINSFFTIVLAAFIASTLANLSMLVTGDGNAMAYALISSSLFMIPGIPLINAVDDLFSCNYLSGLCRSTYASLVMGSMALGITLALHFEFSSSVSYLNITPTNINPIQLLAAAIGAVGFSTLFNTPKRLLPLVALGGLVSVGIRNLLLLEGMSLIISSFVASVVISFLMMQFTERSKTTTLVLAIPSVIPLIPGVLLYRLMYGIIQIDKIDGSTFLQAQRAGFTGIFTVICISLGVALPTLVGQRYIDRKKLNHLLELVKNRALRNGYKF